MDAIYGLQRHFYDLTRKYYLLGRDRLVARLDVPVQGTALEIGCGTGRNIALAARRYPTAKLHGIDISSEMLRTAEAKLDGLIARDAVRLARGDATSFEAARLFCQSQFDRVWFSYTLSMIPEWQAAFHHGLNLVAPGGSLHIVDFGQQSGLPGWFRSILRAWLLRFHVTPRANLIGHCADMAQERNWLLEIERPYRDYTWFITLRRPPRPQA
jgi:S-adenosylmethionine-diacylgycerolhomoserine-N-methlytransferase